MGHTLTANGEAPEAARYYSQMTENQKAEIRHDTVLAIMDDARLAVRVIDPEEEAERIERIMADADERTREVLERYGGLHPVTFGIVGIRGYASVAPRDPSASGAPSSCADPSTLTESTSFWRATSQPPTRTSAWVIWPVHVKESV
jgi:hypothetical protein